MIKVFLVVLFLFLVISTQPVWGLYQPWIAEQAARAAYNQKKATYSPINQQKLENLDLQIKAINKKRTDELWANVNTQAAILDEYVNRHRQSTTADKARYWLTYAEEAVAFQQGKNYIINLTTETNIKSDSTQIVKQFETDLEALRPKVINSQTIIQNLVK